MKNLIIVILIFLPFYSKQQSLVGFGEIKLGKSVSEITSDLQLSILIVNEDKSNKRDLSRNKQVVPFMPVNYQITSNKILYKIEKVSSETYKTRVLAYNNFYDTTLNKGNLSLYIYPKYVIGGIEVQSIFLLFKNDKLVLIEPFSRNGDLLDALINKYPPETNLNKIDSVKCKFVYTGAETNNFAFYNKVVWRNEMAYIIYLFNESINSECKKDFESYFRFFDKQYYSEVLENNNMKKLNIEKINRRLDKNLMDSL